MYHAIPTIYTDIDFDASKRDLLLLVTTLRRVSWYHLLAYPVVPLLGPPCPSIEPALCHPDHVNLVRLEHDEREVLV